MCFVGLGQYATKPLIETISIEIFLILFTVRLRKGILDPVDPV